MSALNRNTTAKRVLDRARLLKVADGLAVALAASLPWSTSATGILVALWLIAVMPTLTVEMMRRELRTPAGGLPVVLWAFGVVGMLWADAPWAERIDSLSGFHKLLVIPFLLAHFRRSERGGRDALVGFLAACAALMIVSWTLFFNPALQWNARTVGIPVKDYITQAAMFAVCIVVLAHLAVGAWRDGRTAVAGGLLLLAAAFLANIVQIAPSRTAFVVLPVLLVLFIIWHRSSWKEPVAVAAVLAVVAGLAWQSSTMRERVTALVAEVTEFRPTAASTPGGERIEFWRKSLGFVADAPIVGHGTGATRTLFRRAAEGQTGMAALVTANPHNQTLAVAVQLGAAGAALLFAIWGAHLLLFGGGGLAAWVGLMVVSQNMVSSLFNSHLFDFTMGWAYVVGVGIAGGVALGQKARGAGQGPPPAG